jgi:hypothetical protein
VVKERQFYPTFWDSPAYAQNLQWAYEGFPGSNKLAAAADDLRATFNDGNSALMALPGSDLFIHYTALQKKVHTILMQAAFVDNEDTHLITLVQRRLTKLFSPYSVDFGGDVDLRGAFSLLSHLPQTDKLKVIKTWLNGWATSARMHEDPILPCLLGCPGCYDSLNHYLQCPHLYTLCAYFFNASQMPFIRIGIMEPELKNLKILACVFSAYHALKGQVRSGLINARTDTGNDLHRHWSVFANALAAEAGERNVRFIVFSLPKLLSFIAAGCSRDDRNSVLDNN